MTTGITLPFLLGFKMSRPQSRSPPTEHIPQASVVRKNLFGPIDHEENLKFVHDELNKISQADCKKWNFDFQAERPIHGRYSWQPVSEKVPQAYEMRAMTCARGIRSSPPPTTADTPTSAEKDPGSLTRPNEFCPVPCSRPAWTSSVTTTGSTGDRDQSLASNKPHEFTPVPCSRAFRPTPNTAKATANTTDTTQDPATTTTTTASTTVPDPTTPTTTPTTTSTTTTKECHPTAGTIFATRKRRLEDTGLDAPSSAPAPAPPAAKRPTTTTTITTTSTTTPTHSQAPISAYMRVAKRGNPRSAKKTESLEGSPPPLVKRHRSSPPTPSS